MRPGLGSGMVKKWQLFCGLGMLLFCVSAMADQMFASVVAPWFFLVLLGSLVLMTVLGRVWHKTKRKGTDVSAKHGKPKPKKTPAALKKSDYSPANVGNDASARPWERYGTAFGVPEVPDEKSAQTVQEPHGLDVAAFLQTSKAHFLTLQKAWDRADIVMLRAMMTQQMQQQVQAQLEQRQANSQPQSLETEVTMLEAQFLNVQALAEFDVVSIEFSGLLREQPDAVAMAFRELWRIHKVRSEPASWLIANVQALQ